MKQPANSPMIQSNQATSMSNISNNTDSVSNLSNTPNIKAIIVDLYINKLKPAQVAVKYGLSERTIYRKMQSEEAVSIRKHVALPIQEDRIAMDLADKAQDALQHITKVKMSKAKLTDIITFISKSVETIRLLTDRSTSNVSVAHYVQAGDSLIDLMTGKR